MIKGIEGDKCIDRGLRNKDREQGTPVSRQKKGARKDAVNGTGELRYFYMLG